MGYVREREPEWVLCPFCGSKTRIRLFPDTELKRFPLFCPKCRRTALVNAAGVKIEIIQKEPDV